MCFVWYKLGGQDKATYTWLPVTGCLWAAPRSGQNIDCWCIACLDLTMSTSAETSVLCSIITSNDHCASQMLLWKLGLSKDSSAAFCQRGGVHEKSVEFTRWQAECGNWHFCTWFCCQILMLLQMLLDTLWLASDIKQERSKDCYILHVDQSLCESDSQLF